MSKKFLLTICTVAIAFCGIVALKYFNKDAFSNYPKGNLTMTSVFSNQEKIPAKYTCDGEDASPELVISGVSTKAKSLVLIVDDPDAPMGTFTHWMLYNIPPSTAKISSQNLPKGSIEGLNDFAKISYGGPCPPSGVHRYFFKLYSIDKILDLSEGATKDELQKAIRGHVIEKTELVGVYSRK